MLFMNQLCFNIVTFAIGFRQADHEPPCREPANHEPDDHELDDNEPVDYQISNYCTAEPSDHDHDHEPFCMLPLTILI